MPGQRTQTPGEHHDAAAINKCHLRYGVRLSICTRQAQGSGTLSEPQRTDGHYYVVLLSVPNYLYEDPATPQRLLEPPWPITAHKVPVPASILYFVRTRSTSNLGTPRYRPCLHFQPPTTIAKPVSSVSEEHLPAREPPFWRDALGPSARVHQPRYHGTMDSVLTPRCSGVWTQKPPWLAARPRRDGQRGFRIHEAPWITLVRFAVS